MAPLDRLAARLAEIQSLDGVSITAGLQGRGEAPGEMSPDQLVVAARANEYGTDTIPSRPAFRTIAKARGPVWLRGLTKAAEQVAQGNKEGGKITIRQVGVVMVADVQGSLQSGEWTPNAPSTIKAKGSDVPLVDTSQTVQSIRAAIEGPGIPPELVG